MTTRNPDLALACEMSGERESLLVRRTHHASLVFQLPGDDEWSVIVGPEQLQSLRDLINLQLEAA